MVNSYFRFKSLCYSHLPWRQTSTRCCSLPSSPSSFLSTSSKLLPSHFFHLFPEPTNDLDVDTLRSLEEAIHGFAGSVIIVSHDRWFLDRVCSHTIAFEDASSSSDVGSGSRGVGDRVDMGGEKMKGESRVVFYRGNYGEYAKQAGGSG